MDPKEAAPSALEASRFAGVIRRHQAAVWRYLRYLGCDAERAEDLTQETFLRVWRRQPRVRDERAVSAYLRRTARNLFLMAVRRKQVRPLFEDLDAADAVWGEQAEDGGDRYLAALRVCLEALTQRARDALDAFYGGRRSRDAVAERLGMTADGVKTLLRRTRERLRTCVEGKVDA